MSQNDHNYSSIPWVEKYRPTTLQEIVLDQNNRRIFDNIVKSQKFSRFLREETVGIILLINVAR